MEFCGNKPKNEKCIDCMCKLVNVTTMDELIRGERHYIRGFPLTYCARDEKQTTKKQALEFWNTIPPAEREEKYGGFSEFILRLTEMGYIRD